MLFNSFAFLVFFPIVVGIYFTLPGRWQWAWLLASSCFFYGWVVPQYLPLLGGIILVDYVAGIAIESQTGARRRLFLLLSFAANLGTLFFFKYWNFANSAINDFSSLFGGHHQFHHISAIIPVGLSFHTFQALSYTIEVYRGNQKAERHLGIYALYVMFFPQLVAGPIERPQNLLHQLRAPHEADYLRIRSGLQLMAWGFLKKIVIADTLAVIVDAVFNNPVASTGPTTIIATVCFAYQIYCDFSGYSDIAIGAAEVMGIALMKNFDRPYAAKSLGEFWHRWHISLSTWFRDYVYFPLGGSRCPKWRTCMNLLIVFVLSGLWHGANWTFLIWGLFLGLGRVAEFLESKYSASQNPIRSNAMPTWLRRAITFTVVCIGWVFFRSDSLRTAFNLFTGLPLGWHFIQLQHNVHLGWNMIQLRQQLHHDFSAVGLTIQQAAAAIILISLLEFVQWRQTFGSLRALFAAQPTWRRWTVYYAVGLLMFCIGHYGQEKFIYYQF